MENVFRKWDRVYHFVYGWGNIVNNVFPLEVEFDNRKGPYMDMFKDGYLLSFTEYTLEGFSQERPEELPKKGQVVWVRDFENEEWCIRYFVHKFESEYYVTSRNPFAERQNGSYYKFLTTKNPYEDEQ